MLKHTLNPLEESIRALRSAVAGATDYLGGINQRAVAPTDASLTALSALDTDMPTDPQDPVSTIDMLNKLGSPATVATTGGRFYGLVVGGSLPATVGTRVLAAAWDQLATSEATSPVSMQIERTTARWLLRLFGLPLESSVGFVSGTTMGNFICLAAARTTQLSKQGWDVEKQGLVGSPPLHIVASEEIHVTVSKVLSMLGLGSANIDPVKTDPNGAMLLDHLPALTSHSIVLCQAGNVNSGAIDPIGAISERARKVGAWVHVDGAFGLWAAACNDKRELMQGFELADSWVTDGHKWLNTPYDCGIAFCRHPQSMHQAMSTVAPYLTKGFEAAPKDMVPELSRSARALDVWAALHSLGETGVDDLINRCCRHARTAADALDAMGFDILNKVSLNQVVVSHPTHEARLTDLVDAVCASGEAWFGVTRWKGRDGFRLSFSSWVTQDSDIHRLVSAIAKYAEELKIPIKV